MDEINLTPAFDWLEFWTVKQAEKELMGAFKFKGFGFYIETIYTGKTGTLLVLPTHDPETHRFYCFTGNAANIFKSIAEMPILQDTKE